MPVVVSRVSLVFLAVASNSLGGCLLDEFDSAPQVEFMEGEWHMIWYHWPKGTLFEETVRSPHLNYSGLNASHTFVAGRLVQVVNATHFELRVTGRFQTAHIEFGDEVEAERIDTSSAGGAEERFIANETRTVLLDPGSYRVRVSWTPLDAAGSWNYEEDAEGAFGLHIVENDSSW